MPAGAIPFPFGECRICNDKATGVHYGVATCEGCKGFFKRSTTKSEKYKCFFGSQCVITPQNRNRCKYCRYKRCLEKGMAIDAVKMGRIPKIDKERALEAAQSSLGLNAQPNNDEGHLSSSDSGISDTMCQQIAERIFPILPSGDCRPPGLKLPSDCDSPELNARNSGTPCSVTSATSDTFTLQSSSGKRWHYSTDLIKELLNQVMGAGNCPESNVLKKVLRSLGQQQDSADKKAALQDSGIDSPPSVDFQSICKKLVKSSHRDDKSSRNMSSGLQNDTSKFSEVKSDKPSIPHGADFSSTPPFSGTAPYSFNNSGHSEFHPLNAGTKRQGDNNVEGQPATKVSTLETLLRNQFLPPSKMEDIDRFLSDALRHSGAREDGNYEDLLDSSLAVTQSADVLSPDLLHVSLPTVSHAESSFVVPGENSGGQCSNAGQLGTMFRSCPQVSYGQLPDSYHMSPNSPLSSPVDSQFYPNHSIPVASPSSPSHLPDSTHNNYQNYLPPGHAYSTLPSSSPMYPCHTMAYDGQPVTYDDYIMDSKHKTLPGTGSSYAMNNYHGRRRDMNYHSADMSTGTRFIDHDGQYSSSSVCPPINSPPMTSPPLVLSPPSFTSVHSQPYQSSLSNRTVQRHSESPTRAAPASVGEPSTRLCAYEPKSEDFLCYDKDLMFDSMEPSSISVLPPDPLDPLLPPSDLGTEGMGKNKALMERTLQRLSEADIKHNQPLRDNMVWMKEFIADKGLCRHPPGDKSPAGIERTWNQLIGSVESVNGRIIGFCTDVPDFNTLDEEDRKLMTGKAYYDIWMVTASAFFVGGESYLQFPSGEPYTREWMIHFLKEPFVDMMFDFAKRLNSCKLTDLELAVLCAIQLTYPDRDGIKKLDEARSLHSHYLDVLDYSMSKSHPNNHSRLLIDIFNLLPVLSKINQLQQEVIANFAVDGPPGMSEKPNDSEYVETINDLQNRFREEMSLKTDDTPLGDG